MNNNKILFVSNTANFSKFNLPFINWFKQQGWIVDYASSAEEEIKLVDNNFKIDIVRNPFSKNNIRAIKELQKLIKQEGYRIVHCHAAVAGFVTRIACKNLRKRGVKVIYTTHGFNFYKGAPFINNTLYFYIEKKLSKYTDILVTINNEDYQVASKEFYTKEIVKIDGVGVDLDKFKAFEKMARQKLRKNYGYNKNDFILLYIAEFIPRKNHKMLFEILPDLRKDIPNLKLILCGKGELLEDLKNKAKELNISEVIDFAGYRKDINNICNISDVYVTTSFQEGLPISVVEAMSSGLPIVASRIRGQVDAITDGRNGFLFDVNSSEDLKKSIYKLYENPELTMKFSKNNITDSIRFSVNIAVESMSKIYKTIM